MKKNVRIGCFTQLKRLPNQPNNQPTNRWDTTTYRYERAQLRSKPEALGGVHYRANYNNRHSSIGIHPYNTVSVGSKTKFLIKPAKHQFNCERCQIFSNIDQLIQDMHSSPHIWRTVAHVFGHRYSYCHLAPVSGAEQLKTSGAINDLPVCSAMCAYSALVSPTPNSRSGSVSTGMNMFQRPL